MTGLVRARMAELVAVARGDKREREVYFTVGLFSVVDALMDTSLIEVLRQLPFSQEIMDALLNYDGRKGELLHGILAYERGDFGPLLRADAGRHPARRLLRPGSRVGDRRRRRPRRRARRAAQAA